MHPPIQYYPNQPRLWISGRREQEDDYEVYWCYWRMRCGSMVAEEEEEHSDVEVTVWERPEPYGLLFGVKRGKRESYCLLTIATLEALVEAAFLGPEEGVMASVSPGRTGSPRRRGGGGGQTRGYGMDPDVANQSMRVWLTTGSAVRREDIIVFVLEHMWLDDRGRVGGRFAPMLRVASCPL